MNRTEEAEINAVKQGCIVAIMAVVALVIICLVVLSWDADRTEQEQAIEDARIEAYEAGYMAGSRNCVKSYTETWGE